MKYTCKQCGKEFDLEQAEIEFYESRNLDLPKRCKECRDANKQKKRQRAAEYRKKKQQNRTTENTLRITQLEAGENVSEAEYQRSSTYTPGVGTPEGRAKAPGMKKQQRAAEYRRKKQEQTTERAYPTAQPETRGKRSETEHRENRADTQRTERPDYRRNTAGTEHTKDMARAQEIKKPEYAENLPENEKPGNEDGPTIRSIFIAALVFLAFLAVLCVLLVWNRSKKDASQDLSAAKILQETDGLPLETGLDSAEEYEATTVLAVEHSSAFHKLEAENGEPKRLSA